jgi:hypothetical protein
MQAGLRVKLQINLKIKFIYGSANNSPDFFLKISPDFFLMDLSWHLTAKKQGMFPSSPKVWASIIFANQAHVVLVGFY